MWLPTPVYESLPCAYIIGGALFVSGAIYMGSGLAVTPLYFAVGVFSILSGVFLIVKRRQSRRKTTGAASAEASE
jgi:membrane protein implicated in regulation of membrane protease activity